MKYSLQLAILAGLAASAPFEVQKRQDTATFANDLLSDTTCRPYYLIVARGSTEADNLVSLLAIHYSFQDINRP